MPCPWCSRQEARHAGAKELREQIMKLGMLTDGNYGHPDQARRAKHREQITDFESNLKHFCSMSVLDHHRRGPSMFGIVWA